MKSKNLYAIETSPGSVRKYPKVIWFPRSKTDPREIREVLKLALKAENESEDHFFNDKLLGEVMARVGSINVVGVRGEEYIKSYKGKTTGDVSYITNARMLIRLFRFLGLVTRASGGKFKVTDKGILYTKFKGDFPSTENGESEEDVLLECLANFTFYSVNDTPQYRESYFQLRPFVWLLQNLNFEPQCIYQLIITAFGSRDESTEETKRIKTILGSLRNGKTNLSAEWKKLGLNPDDYSCVHNFYDSVKILVYLGTSLGLITKYTDLSYGKKIAGKAKHLKQATVFYKLTEKGQKLLESVEAKRPIYYSQIYSVFGDDKTLPVVFMLASLNSTFGSKSVLRIRTSFMEKLIGLEVPDLIKTLDQKFKIKIAQDRGFIQLESPITFNFWQSVPPEIHADTAFSDWYQKYIEELLQKDKTSVFELSAPTVNMIPQENVVSEFILEQGKSYSVPNDIDDLDEYVYYADKKEIFGGSDRFPARVSPTNSVWIVDNKIHIDNNLDCLDLLIPLRRPDEKLRSFIDLNLDALLVRFMAKTDQWDKDRHYTWVRNSFRLLGFEATYTGSSGMLSRADVSLMSPVLAGIEIKSPIENRGTINTKAIRQSVDAKIQVAHYHPEKASEPRLAIAIGRRISGLAIKEQEKWLKEGQPVVLIHDFIIYYLTLKSADLPIKSVTLSKILLATHGVLSIESVLDYLGQIGSSKEAKNRLEKDRVVLNSILKSL